MDLLLAVGSRRRNNPIIQRAIINAVNSLPVLRKSDVDPEEMCAICLNSFEAVFQEEVDYVKEHKKSLGLKESSTEGEDDLLLGLTKVQHCGHTFCRRDLAEWIRGFHGSCPTCRHPFLELPAESDDESSDGGEYVPDEEDEQDYFDFTDYSEADALAPSESELMEINEIAQARDDAEADALPRENTTSEIATEEERSGDESSPAPEEEQENSGSASPTDNGEAVREPPTQDDTPDLAEHFRLFRPEQFRRVPDPEGDRMWEENQRRRFMQPRPPPELITERLVAYELGLLGSYEAQFRDSEEWLRQRQEEEAAAEHEIMSRRLRGVAAQDEELEEDLASAADYMGDESGSEDEYNGNTLTSGSDTVMDVVFSDSSSDLDYEPEDYMMNSDSEGSDSEDMSSDYGVNKLVYLDQPDDSVAIHGESSSDGLLSLATTSDEKASPPRSPVEHRAPGRATR